jgi:hypothetical protein
MIDDHEAVPSGMGEHHGATGDPAASVSNVDPLPPPVDEQPPGGWLAPRGWLAPEDGPLAGDEQPPEDWLGPEDWLAPEEGPVAEDGPVGGDPSAVGAELERAEDLGLGEAERALLQWALRRQSALGAPLLPVAKARPEADAPSEADASSEPTRDVAPEPAADAPPEAPPERERDESRSPWDVSYGSAEEAITALVAAGGPDPRDFASPRLTRRAKMMIALALVVLFVVSALGGFVGYRLTHRAAAGGPEAVGRPAQVRGGTV